MMKFVDVSMSILFLSAAFMALMTGLWLANEVYLCHRSPVDPTLQEAYNTGYQDGFVEVSNPIKEFTEE